MLKLPTGIQTFQKSYLGGDGEVRISSDLDAWASTFTADRPFTRDIDDVAEIRLQAGDAGRDLELGEADGLQLTLTADGAAHGSIRLFWPGEKDDLLGAHGATQGLTPGKLYAAVTLDGTAQASGSFPTGPLSSTFGLGGGGTVSYTRLKLYNQTDSARDILSDLLGGIRLPQAVHQREEIPQPGEVVALNYGGYLRVKSATSWGYALNGLRSEGLEDLDVATRYGVRLAAGLDLGYRLAGDFNLEAHAGSEPGWVRFVVKKSRTARFPFAADLALDDELAIEGLPRSADDVLAALLRIDLRGAMAELDRATRVGGLTALRQSHDALALGFFEDLAERWLEAPLSEETLSRFLAEARQALDAFSRLDDRLVHLYETYHGRLDELATMLDKLDAIHDRSQLAQIHDPQIWQMIERVWGEQLYSLLLQDGIFRAFRDFITTARSLVGDIAFQGLRDLVEQAKASLGLEALLRRVSAFRGASGLQSRANARLSAFVDRLLDTAFTKLENSARDHAFDQLRRFLTGVDTFRAAWADKVRGALRESLALQLSYAFTRAGAGEPLIDVEVHLGSAGGDALARAAARGDFSRVLEVFDPNRVRVRPGALTHKLEASTRLQINLFGWAWGRAVDLVRNLEHRIDAAPGGLVQVYTLDTQVRQRDEHERRFKEEQQSQYLLQAVGAAFQPLSHGAPLESRVGFLLESLRRLAVEHILVERSGATRVEELTEALLLAEDLGLLTEHAELVAALHRELPDGLAAARVRYLARYDDQAVRSLFSMSDSTLVAEARATVRRLVAAKYTASGPGSPLADVGLSYLSPAAARYFQQGILAERARSVVLPAWLTGDAPREVAMGRGRRLVLNALFEAEDKLIDRLQRLGAAIDRAVEEKEPVPLPDLERAARRFVSMADDLERFGRRANAFFAVFDHLVQVGSGGKGRRESALVLELTMPGGERVTKICQSAPRRER